ncbi:hypothetical protein LINPERPRIM_LOCUS5650 [Linum perenne]
MEFSLYVVTPAVVIAVSVVNCVVLLVGGAIAGFIWRNKYTEKKIRGSNNVHKLVNEPERQQPKFQVFHIRDGYRIV